MDRFAYRDYLVQEKAWRKLAERNGFTYEPGDFFEDPRVTGRHRGRMFILQTVGLPKTTRTQIILSVNNPNYLYLAVYEKDLIAQFVQWFSVSGHAKTEEEEFRRKFVIKSKPKELATRILSSIALRRKIWRAFSGYIELKPLNLRFDQWGCLTDLNYLQVAFSLLNDIADIVESY